MLYFHCLSRFLDPRQVFSLPWLFLLLSSTAVHAASYDRSGTVFGPYIEWSFPNSSYSGNPFDLEAKATFRHTDTGDVLVTGLFFAGGGEWRLRFTATKPGAWTFSTSSEDPDLHGRSGTITISPSHHPGFVTTRGNKWVRSNGQAFVPQYVMYAGPHYFVNDIDRIRSDIRTFIVEHGFSGFHVPVLCRWLNIHEDRCDRVGSENPDLRTFDALDDLIREVYLAGGIVHLWFWGDSERRQNLNAMPARRGGGMNGPVDRRLQRYIAARLGPLPGWTGGYGFDLWEWVSGRELNVWHDNLQALFGWPHVLGARASKNQLDQLSERMGYSSYEQHQPDYAMYKQTIARRPEKPSFSEDRFRFRGAAQRSKDYTFEAMRRGMWHSALAGGVANIWGNLTEPDGRTYSNAANEGALPSRRFPNPSWIKTYARFFERHFTPDMVDCDDLSNGYCQMDGPTKAMNVYREGAKSIDLDLRHFEQSIRIIAVDAKAEFREIELGDFEPAQQTVLLPGASDWALAIGWREPGDPGPVPRPPVLLD